MLRVVFPIEFSVEPKTSFSRNSCLNKNEGIFYSLHARRQVELCSKNLLCNHLFALIWQSCLEPHVMVPIEKSGHRTIDAGTTSKKTWSSTATSTKFVSTSFKLSGLETGIIWEPLKGAAEPSQMTISPQRVTLYRWTSIYKFKNADNIARASPVTMILQLETCFRSKRRVPSHKCASSAPIWSSMTVTVKASQPVWITPIRIDLSNVLLMLTTVVIQEKVIKRSLVCLHSNGNIFWRLEKPPKVTLAMAKKSSKLSAVVLHSELKTASSLVSTVMIPKTSWTRIRKSQSAKTTAWQITVTISNRLLTMHRVVSGQLVLLVRYFKDFCKKNRFLTLTKNSRVQKLTRWQVSRNSKIFVTNFQSSHAGVLNVEIFPTIFSYRTFIFLCQFLVSD